MVTLSLFSSPKGGRVAMMKMAAKPEDRSALRALCLTDSDDAESVKPKVKRRLRRNFFSPGKKKSQQPKFRKFQNENPTPRNDYKPPESMFPTLSAPAILGPALTLVATQSTDMESTASSENEYQPPNFDIGMQALALEETNLEQANEGPNDDESTSFCQFVFDSNFQQIERIAMENSEKLAGHSGKRRSRKSSRSPLRGKRTHPANPNFSNASLATQDSLDRVKIPKTTRSPAKQAPQKLIFPPASFPMATTSNGAAGAALSTNTMATTPTKSSTRSPVGRKPQYSSASSKKDNSLLATMTDPFNEATATGMLPPLSSSSHSAPVKQTPGKYPQPDFSSATFPMPSNGAPATAKPFRSPTRSRNKPPVVSQPIPSPAQLGGCRPSMVPAPVDDMFASMRTVAPITKPVSQPSPSPAQPRDYRPSMVSAPVDDMFASMRTVPPITKPVSQPNPSPAQSGEEHRQSMVSAPVDDMFASAPITKPVSQPSPSPAQPGEHRQSMVTAPVDDMFASMRTVPPIKRPVSQPSPSPAQLGDYRPSMVTAPVDDMFASMRTVAPITRRKSQSPDPFEETAKVHEFEEPGKNLDQGFDHNDKGAFMEEAFPSAPFGSSPDAAWDEVMTFPVGKTITTDNNALQALDKPKKTISWDLESVASKEEARPHGVPKAQSAEGDFERPMDEDFVVDEIPHSHSAPSQQGNEVVVLSDGSSEGPKGLPDSAIVASMVFRHTVASGEEASSGWGSKHVEEDGELEEEEDDDDESLIADLPAHGPPREILADDSASFVSSVTEEASSFYQQKAVFDNWGRQAQRVIDHWQASRSNQQQQSTIGHQPKRNDPSDYRATPEMAAKTLKAPRRIHQRSPLREGASDELIRLFTTS